MPHLLVSGPYGTIFEQCWDYFHPKDSMSGFLQLFQLCFHITYGHIPFQIARVFGAVCLLAMTKPSGGVCPITVWETLHQLISHILCLQFCDTLQHIYPRINLEL
jgi:hypothetical protein